MPGSADQIVSFLKMKLEQRTRNLREAFRKLDKSNTGFLSIEDFEGCLRDFNLRLTRSALAAVVAKYDVNNDGYVSWQEFCTVMTGGKPSAKVQAKLKAAPAVKGGPTDIEQAEENLRRVMYASTCTLTQAFLHINRNRNGYVDPAELARIFRKANLELSDAELKSILTHYDTNKDGKIDINELAKALQADVKRFEGYAQRGQKRARA